VKTRGATLGKKNEVRMRILGKGKFKKIVEDVKVCKNWGIKEESLLYSNVVGMKFILREFCYKMLDDCFSLISFCL
jgi:hypothetical protein